MGVNKQYIVIGRNKGGQALLIDRVDQGIKRPIAIGTDMGPRNHEWFNRVERQRPDFGVF